MGLNLTKREVQFMAKVVSNAQPTYAEVAALVRQLPRRDRNRLRMMLDGEWQAEFDEALASVRAKTEPFDEEEIAHDVAEVLGQVRAERRAESGR